MPHLLVHHDDSDSLVRFAGLLNTLPPEAAAAVCARCILDGHLILSDPQCGGATLPEALAAEGVPPAHWQPAVERMLLGVDGLLASMREMLALHMTKGHDQFDFASAGGFDLPGLRAIAAIAVRWGGLDVVVADAPERRTGIHLGNMQPDVYATGRVEAQPDGGWGLVEDPHPGARGAAPH